ncbi:S-layer homology domain-containing protein [Clostridium merdae]|uniref:S-layer homology domain-containing protein n=1 Tax=Clostridium merdae TaxID=1958780 RepID=UPI000A26C040|nr:S-layer homology domain-containing protein [Clostridium merdae]
MKKRLLSFALALCMMLTQLPISAMAENAGASGASGEIIAFAPLDETEKSVPTGTAIEDLELPEMLTATVKTAVPNDGDTVEELVKDSGQPEIPTATEESAVPAYSGTVEEPVKDSLQSEIPTATEEPVKGSGEPEATATSDNPATATTSSALQAETSEPKEPQQEVATASKWEEKTVEIPVTWTADPEYDGNKNDVYVFTPVMEGYTVSADLPEITVTVGKMPPLAVALAQAEMKTISLNGITVKYDSDFEPDLSSDTIIISNGGNYIISGETTSMKIEVGADQLANITLDNMSIDVRGMAGACALDMSTSARVNLTLIGENSLKSGSGSPGLKASGELTITAKSTASLRAEGMGEESGVDGNLTVTGSARVTLAGAGANGKALTGILTAENFNIKGGDSENSMMFISASDASAFPYVTVEPDSLPFAPQVQWGVAGSDDAVPTTWTQGTLADAISYANLNTGTYIQLLDNINKDNHNTWPLTFDQSKSTILDMNGNDIDRGLTTATENGNVIIVKGSLTIKDSSTADVSKQGCITGGYTSDDTGGGVYVLGIFTLQGGNITGNKTTSSGGGVSISAYCTFNMQGGSVADNEAAVCGGGVYTSNGTFNVKGGSITGNKSANGGVYVSGHFRAGGSVVVKGNTLTASSVERNAVIPTGKQIFIDFPLVSGASIGVTAESVPTVGSPIVVANSDSIFNDCSGYFFSDNSSYLIQKGASNSVQLVASSPTIGTLSIPDSFTAGRHLVMSDLESYKPTVTPNGYTITAQGWENSVNSGAWVPWTAGYIPLDTAATRQIRYYVTYNDGGSEKTITSNAITFKVVGYTTVLALTVSPVSPQAAGNNVTLTAALTDSYAGTAVNGQPITFKSGETTLGTANLNDKGVATYIWRPSAADTYTLTAEYPGNALNKAATSNTVNYTVIVDPNVAAVAAAKNALADGTVNVAFGAGQAAKTAAVKAYVSSLLTGDAAGVTATVTYNSTTGKYDVALSKGSVNGSKSLLMTVNIAPDPDIAIIAGAKSAAQGANYASMTQTAAADEDAIEAAVKNTAVTAVNNSGVTIIINKVKYTAPLAETAENPIGTNGSYTFTVTVLKGGQSDKTEERTITITATPYTGVTNAQAVAAAKNALADGTVNVAFGADQAAKTAAVKAYVSSLLTGDAAGVTATVTYNSTTGKYDVALSKGSVNGSKSLSITMNIAPDPDIAIIAGAKSAAQGANYVTITQTAAAEEDAIIASVKNTAVTAVNNSDITVIINKVSYTAPLAGTSANPTGTNGSYTFTVTVLKGGQSDKTGEKTITITATPYTGGTGGNGNSSSSSTPSKSVDTKPTEAVTGTSENKATVDNKGNASVGLTDKNITDAIANAKAEAVKRGVNTGDITAMIHVSTGGKDANTVTVNLPKTTLEQVIGNNIASVELVIDRPDLTIGMNHAAVTEINRQANADVQLTATRMDNAKLSGDAKAAIGNRPTYDLKALYGGGKSVTNFGNGSVSVEIPYTLQKGEIAGNVYAVYVDTNGKATLLTGSSYDAKRGTVVFSTNHFSTYGIAYKSSFNFTDIGGHWAKDDILFVANRGLLTGSSATTFSPNSSMTRGMFVTALGRLSNVDISAYKKSSFTDVNADAYYMGYIEWSVKNNILTGIGDGKFAPDGLVTREQMAVIMDRYATAIGFKLPEVHTQNLFADNAKISVWAAPSVKRIQMAGIIHGKNNNFYDPQGTATRAELSAVLKRFVELTAFSSTAQGWVKNDSGQWMFFQNGKALTGWQTIHGKIYCFDSIGGAFASGWKQNAKGEWLFLTSDGSSATGWKDIQSKRKMERYYFDTYGILVAGKWLQIDGKWYYFYADGSLAKSTKVDGYEVDENGVRKTK